MVMQAPAFLVGNILAAGIYYILLLRRRSLKGFLWIGVMFLVTAFFNPIVNTRGNTVLFTYWGRVYTFEALQYGIVVGLMLAGTLLWLGCYNQVMTGNKLISLFGDLAPALSLMLVMIFRMIPDFLRKARQIINARCCVGKWNKNLTSGMEVLGILTSWSLENSVITADSMRSRGYGSGKISHYQMYHMVLADGILLILMILLVAISIACRKSMVGTISALLYMLLPVMLRIKEEIQWYILKYRI